MSMMRSLLGRSAIVALWSTIVLGAPLAAAEGTPALAAKAAATKAAATRSAAGSVVGPVDLNAADETTLETLPGVGPALAKQIVAARPFTSVADLAKVKGIGPAKLAALKDKVTVGGAGAAPVVPPVPAKPILPEPPPQPVGLPRPPAMPGLPSAATVPSIPATPAARPVPAITAKSIGKLPAGKVNLNTASEAELEALPGIGPVKAKAIVAGRPYGKPEDVMKVPGIKEGIFGKIKDYITVQ